MAPNRATAHRPTDRVTHRAVGAITRCRPAAWTANTDLACFDEFTFDHVFNRIITACRRDTGEVYPIQVADNVVRERTLRAPDL
jgi:hypothetical protein